MSVCLFRAPVMLKLRESKIQSASHVVCCSLIWCHFLLNDHLWPCVNVTELQAAISVHRYPASFAKHSEGLLASGPRLPLYVHRHAERRRPGTGT